MQNYRKGIIYAAITAFLWGFLAIALKVAVRKVDPITVVWMRFVVAFIILATWQAFKTPQSFKILVKPPILLILAALALSWNYMGYMLGIHHTTPSNAQLFIQTGPLILAIAGFLIFKEKLLRNQIIGFSIAILGFSFFYRDQLQAFFETAGTYKLGILLTISGAVAWSVYAIIQKKLVRNHSVDSLNLMLFGLPAILYLPFIEFQPLLELHWTWWLLLLFLGANTFVAYTCIGNALKYIEANKVSIIIILNPMITFITMGILTELNVSWVEHERFSMVTIAGALLVFIGAVLVARKNKSR
ncbi:DMT family transporter [Draconibacterium halophilum]|uniref:DMT family transporter n=1 Tax=Draconibacterium halophilum TaxID=2706887 RepID=A0A6C0RF87_9BACT|nr:DMT family transporter [Draconibacterium halophilum]QIA07741.1 DMT family transporter [Draconibacterium halophilum]